MVHLNSIRANQLDLKKVGPQDGKEEAMTAGGMQPGIAKGIPFSERMISKPMNSVRHVTVVNPIVTNGPAADHRKNGKWHPEKHRKRKRGVINFLLTKPEKSCNVQGTKANYTTRRNGKPASDIFVPHLKKMRIKNYYVTVT